MNHQYFNTDIERNRELLCYHCAGNDLSHIVSVATMQFIYNRISIKIRKIPLHIKIKFLYYLILCLLNLLNKRRVN